MRNFLKVVLLLTPSILSPIFLLAQNSLDGLDSLRKKIELAPSDCLKLQSMMDLSLYHYNSGDFAEALNVTKSLKKFSLEKGSFGRAIRIEYNLGTLYMNLAKYDSAKFFLTNAVELSIKEKNDNALFQSYNSLGSLENYLTNYSGALEYFFKSIEILERPGNEELRVNYVRVYGNIANNLIPENEFSRAIFYIKKALESEGDEDFPRFKVQLHLVMSDAYMGLSQPDSALIQIELAEQLADELENIQINTSVMNYKGGYFLRVNEFEKAIQYLEIANDLADSTGNSYLKSNILLGLADANFQSGKVNQSLLFATKSKDLALAIGRYDVASQAFLILQKIASERKEFERALEFAMLHKQYGDSTLNEKTKLASLALESKYQSERREKEIIELNLINKAQELEVTKRNRLLAIGGIGSLSLIFILGLFYRTAKQRQIIAEKDQKLQEEKVKFLEGQQQVISLQSMINGQETERTRIAKDLHDGLGGLFSTIKMHFSTLQHEQPELKSEPLFAKSYEMVNTASEEVRRIAHNMMPEVLIKLGLVQATQELCNSISAGKLLKVSMQTYGMNQRLSSSTEVMLFRILQELLNNIIKHSEATEAIIQFNREGNRLSVTVEDNGRGFNTTESDSKSHAGLSSVESRVHYLNGKMSIDSQQNLGTTVMMDFLIND